MKHLLLKTMMLVLMLFVGMGAWAGHTLVRADQMVSGEKYIITAKYNSTTYYLTPGQFSAGSSTVGTYTSSLTEAAAWTFTKNGSTWTISTVVNGTTYYLGHNNTNNGVKSTTTSANYTVSASTTGANTVHMVTNSRYLALYQGTNWRCYSDTKSGSPVITLYRVDSPTYTLTFANNINGTFSAKVDGNTVTSGSKVEAGKTVTLTAEPNDGYVFNAWNVYKTANQYNYVTVANNTFTMPSEAVTVDAYFIEGKTIPNVEVSLAAGTYRGEQSVTITNFDEGEYAYYYTLDGTTPAIDEACVVVGTTQEYTGSISITESCTLSILTTDFDDSKVNTFAYVIEYPYTVTIEEPVNGTLTVMYGETPVKSGDKFYKGETITATANPAEGYKFRMLQFTDATNHNFTASNVKEWNMGDHDVTISATFDEIKYYTVAFSVNGTIVQSDVLEENTTISVPAVSDINGKKFVGWVKTPTVDAGSAPTYETIEKATEAVTYYAVFAIAEGVGVETWNKVSDAGDLHENDVIAIVGSEAVDYNILGSADKHNGIVALSKTQNTNNRAAVVVTLDGEKLNYIEEVQQITLTKGTFDDKSSTSQTDWQLGVDGGFLYVCSSEKNYLKTQAVNDINGLWNISITDGKATIIAKYSSYTRNYMRVNGNYSNSTTFAPIVSAYSSTSSTGVLATIYKKTGGATYSDFTTLPNGDMFTVVDAAFDDVTKAYYATYYTDHCVTVPRGCEAATVNVSENKMNLSYTWTEGKVIPANTGVVIKANEAGTYTYAIGEENDITAVNGTNYLKGSTTEAETVGENCKFYKLSKGSNGIGFYWGKADGAAFNSGAKKAYLAVPTEVANQVKGFAFSDADEATAIFEVATENDSDKTIYNLAGQRVEKAVKGLYIVNGKKVLVK